MRLEDKSLPGWTFDLEEISAGHYRITGRHIDGRSVSRDGDDDAALLKACLEDAQSLPAKR